MTSKNAFIWCINWTRYISQWEPHVLRANFNTSTSATIWLISSLLHHDSLPTSQLIQTLKMFECKCICLYQNNITTNRYWHEKLPEVMIGFVLWSFGFSIGFLMAGTFYPPIEPSKGIQDWLNLEGTFVAASQSTFPFHREGLSISLWGFIQFLARLFG